MEYRMIVTWSIEWLLLYNTLVHVSGLIKCDKMKIDHHLKSDKQKGKTKSGQTLKKKKKWWLEKYAVI